MGLLGSCRGYVVLNLYPLTFKPTPTPSHPETKGPPFDLEYLKGRGFLPIKYWAVIFWGRGEGRELCELRAPLSARQVVQACPVSFTSLLGAGSQEVDHIQMMANVSQDLEFGHQSFVLTGCGPLCVRSKEKSGLRDNGAASALPWRQHACPPGLSLLH